MNKRILNIFTVVAVGAALIGCKNKAKEAHTTEAEVAAVSESTSQKYVAVITESVIQWQGYKPTGTHIGTINLEQGEFTVSDRQIDSGSFVITMNSIKESEANERLEGHLKSADFFDVELISNKLKDTLKLKGLSQIEIAQGDVFNADDHEAVTQIPAPNDDLKGKIIDVVEKGYALGDKVIRFPKVIIGQ